MRDQAPSLFFSTFELRIISAIGFLFSQLSVRIVSMKVIRMTWAIVDVA